MNKQQKVTINWYPGHMAKTKREIKEILDLIDVVIEILDARIPISSQNPDIKEMAKNKKKIILLNKCDLADEKETRKWQMVFENKGISVAQINANNGKGIKQVIDKIEEVMAEEIKEAIKKGRTRKNNKVSSCAEYQTFGKSSFINRISNKNSLKVQNKPGVTIKNQWIRLSKNIELLDTPGVLWPKFEDEKIGLNLAFTGTIKDEILDKDEIAFHLVKYLINNHLNLLISKYKLDEEEIRKMIENQQDENEVILEIIEKIGKTRGALKARRKNRYAKNSKHYINRL